MTHFFDLRTSGTGYGIDLAYLFLGTNGIPLAKDAYLPEQSLTTGISWLVQQVDSANRPIYDSWGNPVYIRDYNVLHVFHGGLAVTFDGEEVPNDYAPDWSEQPAGLLSATSAFTVAGSTGASGGTGYLRFFGLETPSRHFSPGRRDWDLDGPHLEDLAAIAKGVEDNYVTTLESYAARRLSSVTSILAESETGSGLLRMVYIPDKTSSKTVGDMVKLNRTDSYPDEPNPYYATARELHDVYRGEDVRVDLTNHVDQLSAIWGFAARHLEVHSHDGDDVIDFSWFEGEAPRPDISALDLPQTILIDGGTGDDRITLGHVGAATLIGGEGNDEIWYYNDGRYDPTRPVALLSGGAGQDTLYGATFGRNRLEGGAGDDAMNGGAGADTILGGDGHDVITGSAFVDPGLRYGANDIAADYIDGGNGDDTITGSQLGDVIHGGGGDDYIYGDAQGGAGNDTIYGGEGDDIYGFEAPSSYRGMRYSHGFGHDVIHDTGGTLEFATRYEDPVKSTTNVAFTRIEDDLRIDFPVIGNSITLKAFYRNPEAWKIAGYDGAAAPFSLAEALRLPSSRVAGTEGDDLLRATAGVERLLGLGGNDTLLGEGIATRLQGDAGNDLLAAAAARDLGGDPGGSIYRLYEATLNRAPDASGYAHWLAQLQSGSRSLTEIAHGFVASAEFQKVYGALSNAQFVTLLYQNVLGRAPSELGAASWLAQLESGASRAKVVTGFSESTEFRTKTNGFVAAYVDAGKASSWADDIHRLYMATLDRAPDLNGLISWTARLVEGASLEVVASGFTNSAEFKAKYGSLSNADFVGLLYRNVLDRAADAGGLAHWTTQLSNGMSREKVVLGFSQSTEFSNRTSAAFLDRMQGFDGAQLDGGSGNDVLIGTLLADTFQFALEDKGSDRVLGLAAWDRLEFDGFGYVDRDDVMAHVTRSGAHLIFEDRGVKAVFENLASGVISEVEFLL